MQISSYFVCFFLYQHPEKQLPGLAGHLFPNLLQAFETTAASSPLKAPRKNFL